MSAVAVLDIGKTNIKLSAASRDGAIVETLSAGNITQAGPPYRHPDLGGIEAWLLDALRSLARRHKVTAIVATCHGSAGVLVDAAGPVMPMVDYEQEVPAAVNAAYAALAAPAEERGSPIMPGAAHLARQLLWIETEWPEAFSRGRWFLGGPQYWAWRLSGVAASELTYLGAQSHLWNIPERRFARIVGARGWARLLPPIRPAWAVLGPVKTELARRFDLPPDMAVLCGIHDSSANFYRYGQAGLSGFSVVSTGTWIVGVSDRFVPGALSQSGGATWNADVHGKPLTGVLAMGGREFAIIAGEAAERAGDPAALRHVVEAGTLALPSFVKDDGPFPGSAGRGRVVGPPPETPDEKRALALLYVALLTDACLDLMGSEATTILDGSFVRDPLYGALVAALRAERVLVSTDAYGTAAGAALVADHAARSAPAPVETENPAPLAIPGLDKLRDRWRDLAANPQES